MIQALTVCDLRRLSVPQLLEERIRERALANAGLAGDEHDPAAARACVVEHAGKLGELGRSPDQPGRLRDGGKRQISEHGLAAAIRDRSHWYHQTITAPVP